MKRADVIRALEGMSIGNLGGAVALYLNGLSGPGSMWLIGAALPFIAWQLVRRP